jgi:hypothetical protein
MSTSATAVFKDGNQKLCVIWKHGDGHPDAFGLELALFLVTKRLVNGLAGYDDKRLSNGMQDMAAQAVCFFKGRHPVGGVYLAPTGTKLGDSDYCYNVQGDTFKPGEGVTITPYDGNRKMSPAMSPVEFRGWCESWK